MKSIVLPAGTEHVLFGKLAHLIADALWPDAGPNDDRMAYTCASINFDEELARAVKSGALPVKDPLTLGPHTFPMGDALNRAFVSVDDLREFVAGRGLSVRVDAPEPTAAPVVAVGDAWHLIEPKRYQGYTKPLYDLLKAAHAAGKPCPKARDVIDAWTANRPFDVFEVEETQIGYYDATGTKQKFANLDAIRKAIGRMTGR